MSLGGDRDAARAQGAVRPDERGDVVARTWLYVAGVALLAAGLVGFADNPVVSRRPDALLHVDTIQGVVLLMTGLIALFIGASQHGRVLAQATIAFGGVYLVLFCATLVSPDLSGILATPVTPGDLLLHLVVAAGSIVAGLASTWQRGAG